MNTKAILMREFHNSPFLVAWFCSCLLGINVLVAETSPDELTSFHMVVSLLFFVVVGIVTSIGHVVAEKRKVVSFSFWLLVGICCLILGADWIILTYLLSWINEWEVLFLWKVILNIFIFCCHLYIVIKGVVFVAKKGKNLHDNWEEAND